MCRGSRKIGRAATTQNCTTVLEKGCVRSSTLRGEVAKESGKSCESWRLKVPYTALGTFAYPCHRVAHGGEIGMREALVDIPRMQDVVALQAFKVLVDTSSKICTLD